MPVVTLLDTLGIQDHVFATNRLRDAVGGSALVECVADWVKDVCPPSDILLAAAGNVQCRFPDETAARSALAHFSRRAHHDAPGLEFVAVHQPYQPGQLVKVLREGFGKLAEAKASRSPSVPLLGLGVTASCRETRRPATTFDVEGQPISADVAARRKPDLLNRWDNRFLADHARFSRGGGPARRLRFPVEMDRLGRSRDDRSLVGVVHVDGNGVGARLTKWLDEQAAGGRDDEAFLIDYRQLSQGLSRLGEQAFRDVVNRVVAAVGHEKNGYEVVSRRLGHGFALSSDEESLDLPLRPVILGGDDLTFVCDGRLALDLAAATLAGFEKSDVSVLGRVHACAGVAITGVRAPLMRAYGVAAAQCDAAKKLVRDSGNDQPALGWHVGLSGSVRVTTRPYLLGEPAQTGTWRWLDAVVLGPTGFHGPAWRERRNKVKALRDLSRDGPGAVARALEAWKLVLPAGLEADNSALADAVELLDIHLPLEATPS